MCILPGFKMASRQRISEWRKLPLSLTELSIDTTLRCGQAFRWRKIDDEWFVYPLHAPLIMPMIDNLRN